MSGDVSKSVEVKDLGEGRFEVSYEGIKNIFYWLLALAGYVFVILPASCAAMIGTSSRDSGVGSFIAFLTVLGFGYWAFRSFMSTTHNIVVSTEKLEFSGRIVPFDEIDTIGFEGRNIYVVCSGTRINLGVAKNSDIAKATVMRIEKHSNRF